MTAHNSGMNIVIEFAPAYLDQLVALQFADAFAVRRPEGYDEYRLSPRDSIILPLDTPTPELQLPVTLEGVCSDGTPFSHDLTITFGLHAEVYENSRVRVVLNYSRVSPDEERVSEVLSDLSPVWWEVPLDFLNILDVSLEFVSSAVAVADGALAVGVGVRDHEQNITFFQGDFNTNFVGTGAEISIAVEREVMEMLSRAMIQNAIERAASGEEVFEDYNIQSSAIHWERDHVRIVSEGRFNYASRDWHVSVTIRGTFFVDAVGARIRMHLISNIPDDAALIGEDENYDDDVREAFEEGEADPFSIELDSFDEWSPVALYSLSPGFLEAEASALDQIEHTENELTIHYDASVASFGSPEIRHDVDDELSINFNRRIIMGNCDTDIVDEGLRKAMFSIENTGTGTLYVDVFAPMEIFRPIVLNTRIAGGERGRAGVELLVDDLEPNTYRGSVRIIHNVPGEDEIFIPVEASFTTIWDRRLSSVGERLCKWVDILSVGKEFGWWRSFFEEPPVPVDIQYLEVFDMALKDPADKYEFITQSEAGELLAINGAHTSFKGIHLPVDRNSTISLEVRHRSQPTGQAQGPFFLTMMKRTVQALGSFAVESPRSLAAFESGVCVSTEAGLMVVETIDPWRPSAVANLDIGSLAGLAAFGTKAFAVGDTGLFVLDLSNPNKPNLRQVMEQLSGGRAVRRRGRHLWVAGEHELTVLDISNWEKPVQLAASPLTMPALDLAVYSGRAVVLHKQGLDIFDLGRKQLTLVAKHEVDQAGNKSLSKHGTLVGLSDTKTGTQILDISQPKSPELVAHYSKPFWKVGLSMDFTRGIAYKVRPEGDGFDILLIHVNKLRK